MNSLRATGKFVSGVNAGHRHFPNRPLIIEAKKWVINQELCRARKIADLRPVRAPSENKTAPAPPPERWGGFGVRSIA
jgi:hypothetical protein